MFHQNFVGYSSYYQNYIAENYFRVAIFKAQDFEQNYFYGYHSFLFGCFLEIKYFLYRPRFFQIYILHIYLFLYLNYWILALTIFINFHFVFIFIIKILC